MRQQPQMDPELVAKLRRATGMSVEEIEKTMQLKKEIDDMVETKIHQETSSEESGDHEVGGQMSPGTQEKIRTEKKYKKKFKKVFDTLIDRVDNSSGSNSGDEKHAIARANNKKRKLNETMNPAEYYWQTGNRNIPLY